MPLSLDAVKTTSAATDNVSTDFVTVESPSGPHEEVSAAPAAATTPQVAEASATASAQRASPSYFQYLASFISSTPTAPAPTAVTTNENKEVSSQGADKAAAETKNEVSPEPKNDALAEPKSEVVSEVSPAVEPAPAEARESSDSDRLSPELVTHASAAAEEPVQASASDDVAPWSAAEDNSDIVDETPPAAAATVPASQITPDASRATQNVAPASAGVDAAWQTANILQRLNAIERQLAEDQLERNGLLRTILLINAAAAAIVVACHLC